MNIPQVPDSIPRQIISDFLRSVGIDPSETLEITISATKDAIRVVVYADQKPEDTSKKGTHRFFTGFTGDEEIGRHVLCIPLTGDWTPNPEPEEEERDWT